MVCCELCLCYCDLVWRLAFGVWRLACVCCVLVLLMCDVVLYCVVVLSTFDGMCVVLCCNVFVM